MDAHGDASFSIGNTNTSISSSTPVSQDLETDNLDSAHMLRQLHIDVTKFEGQSIEINEVGGCLSQINASNPSKSTQQLDNNFEKVASELEEAMVVISE